MALVVFSSSSGGGDGGGCAVAVGDCLALRLFGIKVTTKMYVEPRRGRKV